MVMGLCDLSRAIQLLGLGLNFLYLSGPRGPIPCLLPPLVGEISCAGLWAEAGASLRLS